MSDVFEVPPADVPAPPPPEQPPVPVSAPEATNEYDALLAETPKAKPAGNEYDAVVVDLKRERQQRLRATGIVAQGSTPEAAAKAVSLSAKTGLPADLVERNLPKVAGEQKLNEYDALVAKSPKLADWLTADPINAKVASSEGDFSKLSLIEEGVNEITRGVLGQQASSGFAGWKSASRKLGDLEAALGKQARGEYLSPWDRAMIGQEEVIRQTMKDAIINYGGQFYERGEQAAAIPMRPVVEEMQKAGAKGDWGGVWEALKQDPLGAIYSISMQSAYLLPFQIGAFAAAGPAGAFGVSFLAEYMGAVTDAMQEAGVNIADPTQVTAAFADPSIMAKVEKQAAIKAGTIGVFDAASMRLARVPMGVGRNAVTREATNIGVQLGVQAGMGAAGEAAGSTLAGMKVDPFAVVAEALGEMGSTPVEVATARWTAAVKQDATVEQFEKYQRLPALERIAIGQALVVDRLIEQVTNTKIASLSPEKLQDFIASLTETAQSVFIPAQAVASYMQDMTGLQAKQFVERLGIADQIERARVSGEDIAIPLDKYLTGASEAHKAWRNDIRTEVDGFSVRQAQEWETRRQAETKAALDRFEEQIAAGIGAIEPQTRVYQTVLDRLKNSGQYTNEVAAQHAALYAAHYAARAVRNPALYADAYDAYEKAGTGKGVDIRSELPESIRALGPDRLDIMLDSIRSGRDPVKLPKESKPAPPAFDATILKAARRLARGWTPEKEVKAPQSLTDFVRKAGGLNIASSEAGDLRAADLGRIPGLLQKKRSGTKALRSSGQSIDAVAQAALEAGYRFGPETRYGSGVDVDAFLSVLIEDGSGTRKSFPDDADTEAWRAQQDYFNEFFRWLKDDLGWEPKGRTPEEIAKFLSQDDTTQRLMVLAERVDALGADSPEARQLDVELARIKDESLQRLWEEFDERDASAASVDGGSSVPDTGGLTREEWERLHGDIADTIGPEGSVNRDAVEGQSPWLDAEGIVVGAAGDRTAPRTPQEAARARRAEALGKFQSERQQLADALQSLGIDPQWSNAKIRKALDAAVKPDGKTYNQDASLAAVEAAWAAADIKGNVSERNGLIIVSRIVVPENQRGAGVGTKAMQQLADYADATGQRIALTPSSDFGGSKSRLVKFYTGLGFVENKGRRRDFSVSETMIREPRNAGGVQYEQTERGNISFTENGAIIRLFQGRDLSTLIHESGHLWLAELEFDAKAENASEETKAMWQTVLDYVGSKDGYITVEQHELFARAFEAYTMEGKAPSEGLRAAFRSFKNWLVTIYRTLARLNAPLSPEIRQVFDRLLATDEEIAAARTTQGLNPLFADAKSAEMTEAEFKAYTANVTRVVDEAEQKVLAKVMAQIKREKTKELAAEKAHIRKEVTAELMADPGQGALHFLRNGKMFEGETPEGMADKKLDRAGLVALIGEDGLKLLPKGIYAEDGLSPDDVAQQFGLGNGTELTDRLLQIQAEQDAMRAKGDNRSVVNVRIAEETQRRLTEAMGDPLNDGSIEAEAMAAVHSDKQGALMASELKVLARKAGHSGVISLENIKAWAATAIGEMSTYQGTQFAKYQQAERVAGQKVQRALVKGDFVAAFKAKQDQLVNFALYQEAKKAAEDTEKARKLADRYASARTIPNMEQATLDAIHEVLEAYDFRRRSGKLLAERTLFNAWAAEQEKAGHVVVEPPRLKGAQSQHFSQMTVDEIRGLHDSIAQMAHLGRLKKELIVNGQKRDLDNLLTEMEAGAEKLAQRGVTQFREGESQVQEMLGDWRHNFTDARSSLIKMERLFEILDGDKTGRGIFSRALFKPIADAQTVDYDLKVEANKAIKAIYDKVPKEQRKSWATRHSVPEVQAGLTLTKEEIMAIAMNVGNASNLEKLLQGRKWSQVGVTALLDKHLTQEEWTFVQDIWDHIDSYWPQIEALEKEVNGFAPKKVEATPVQTRFGTLRGGYYPMEYNRHASFKADRIARIRETTAAVGELFAPGRAKPSTRAGSTHERVENFNAPVLLSLNVIHNHINEVTQDIAYRKAVMQTYKIVTSERFRGAVQSAVGPEYERQILTWLQRIANEGVQDKVGLSGVDQVLRTMRLNVSIVGMGLRVSTMLQQTVGYSNSIQRLGEAAMANGFRLFASNPKQMTETVFAKSGEMRHRMNGIDRDMRANMKRFTGKEGIRPSVARFAFKGIALFDMAVTIPTWLGAYHQGLGQKMTEQEAIYYADKTVRDTQGAGGNKDMSSLQNGNEAWKLFTMFGSYANVLYNAQLGLWTEGRYGKMTAKKFATLMHQFLYLMILPPILSALVVGNGPDEDDDWLLWAARNVGFGAFQGVPLLRDAASATKNAVEGKFSNGVKLTPVAGIFENLLHLGKDATKIVQGEPPSKTALKNLFNTMGGVMGLPLGQPGLTLQYIVDASTGVEDPEDLWDWVRGLTIGPPKKK